MASPEHTGPVRVDFHRTKYGPEILVDVAWVREMPTFIRPGPHWLAFYDILLVTRGTGHFFLDGHRYRVGPRQVFFTTPGQVRDWQVRGLEGLCLFFPAPFLEEFFADRLFLHRLPYFHVPGNAAAVRLTPARAVALQRRLSRMRRELRTYQADSDHLLRASLYEELVTLARDYAGGQRTAAERNPNRIALRYRDLVEQQASAGHGVARYARELAVSAGHLNLLCRRHLGSSAKEVIQERLEVSARRLLLYSDLAAGAIARQLGFKDPSYFARFFRRRTGLSPAAFRQAAS
ncbi:MAG: helix-turn-helix domain-containing protein [Gemmatimonadales bacterium]